MQEEKQNYGMPGGTDRAEGAGGMRSVAEPSGVRDERAWSVVAHLSIFANLFTGFLGPVVALVIWLVYRDRSETVAFHALQSMWYQVAWLVALAVGWTVTGLLTLVLVGFLFIPVMALVSIVPFVHAAYAAYKVGRDDPGFRYPLVADMLQRR